MCMKRSVPAGALGMRVLFSLKMTKGHQDSHQDTLGLAGHLLSQCPVSSSIKNFNVFHSSSSSSSSSDSSSTIAFAFALPLAAPAADRCREARACDAGFALPAAPSPSSLPLPLLDLAFLLLLRRCARTSLILGSFEARKWCIIAVLELIAPLPRVTMRVANEKADSEV